MKNIVANWCTHWTMVKCLIWARFFFSCAVCWVCTHECVWVCVNWAFECIAPKAYIIGFTNYKAAFLWCCAKEYSEGSHIEGTPKRVYPLHIAQSGQLLHVFVYTPHEMLKHKNELVTHRTFANMVFFSLFIKLLLIAIGLGRISGWTLIFSITSFCFFFHRSGLRVMMCALFFLSLSAESVDLCEILFWLYIFTRSFNRFIPSVLSKWFNFVYRSPFGCVWNSINLHKNRCAYPKHSPPLCLPCRGKILVC